MSADQQNIGGRATAIAVVPELGGRNRDHGKVFKITEWPAARAERWALSMILAANRGAGQLPTTIAGIGMEGIAIIGINTFLRGNISKDELLPLLDELLECVTIVRDPKNPHVATPLMEDEIAEVATRMWLRGEVLSLHLSFSVGAALSALYSKIMTPPPTTSQASPTAPTSPGP